MAKEHFLKDANFWLAAATIVLAIATVLLAYFTYSAVINATAIWEKQLELDRPYFAIIDPGIKFEPKTSEYRIQITLQNEGGRTASDLYCKILMADKSFTAKPQIIEFSIGNELPPGAPNPWYSTVQLSKEMIPWYIVLELNYSDPVLNKTFMQSFFMKWGGIVNGTTEPDFVHTTLEERQSIETNLKKYLRKQKQ